ncbi:alcohol dehydrogenase catalytic domain-containing protein [Pseudonocardia sp. H11422]|uniref:alcohol dehydrogenase catalytic domain-containing protein n=1 Tax=Pseudonocardia sp. H11422 TaxID=2835866 RepID=UPI001BDD5CB7|nr:alcohol dehydrogenase catalytic domain-containing protein [Pseudonocardia sp. H11422]
MWPGRRGVARPELPGVCREPNRHGPEDRRRKEHDAGSRLPRAGDVRVGTVDDPKIVEPTDLIVKTATASMCGSDLYLYGGEVEQMVAAGRTTLGHEICGEVVEVGDGVARFEVGTG